MKSLSPAMRRAIELARANGGKLLRHEGESWAGHEVVPLAGRPAWFTSRTIQALVDRGLAEYRWQTLDGRAPMGVYRQSEAYPVEVTLTERAGR